MFEFYCEHDRQTRHDLTVQSKRSLLFSSTDINTIAQKFIYIIFASSSLTLKLASYFAKHIQARRGGGFIELPLPKNFETANN